MRLFRCGRDVATGLTEKMGFSLVLRRAGDAVGVGVVDGAVRLAQSAAKLFETTGAGAAAPGAASVVLYRWARITRSLKSTLPS